MLSKLFKKTDKKKADAEAAQAESTANDQVEDGLDETGTFMLDVNQLKECEDLEDLLNDV